MEDPETQARVVERINTALHRWSSGYQGELEILVTTSGGMPPLKPLIERVAAIHVGQQHVTLLDQPERGKPGAMVTPVALNYGARVAERETLRFHCAEALRNGDYAGAYGLARRASESPWAATVCNRLGPLLELPGQPLHIKGRVVEPFVLHAVQVEARLCMGDLTGALLRLGPFIESVIWTLIAGDARIRELGLKLERENECLVGDLPDGHELFTQFLQQNSKGDQRHGVIGLTWRWPYWLGNKIGGQSVAARALDQLRLAYSNDSQERPQMRNPRDWRNLLAHGSEQSISLQDIKSTLLHHRLIDHVSQPFGQNFLATELIATLLASLGAADLPATLREYLADLLNHVIEG